MSPTDRGRLPAHCPLCHKPTHDILQWGADGEPVRVGPVLPGTVRLTLALASGYTADVLVCGACAAGAEDRIVEMWGNICRRFAYEHEIRPQTGGRPLTPAQAAHAEADLLRVIHDVPLGVLARREAA